MCVIISGVRHACMAPRDCKELSAPPSFTRQSVDPRCHCSDRACRASTTNRSVGTAPKEYIVIHFLIYSLLGGSCARCTLGVRIIVLPKIEKFPANLPTCSPAGNELMLDKPSSATIGEKVGRACQDS